MNNKEQELREIFNENEIVMTFDEAIAAIRNNDDTVINGAYIEFKLKEDVSNKEGDITIGCRQIFRDPQDWHRPFSDLCIYLDTLTSKYEIVKSYYLIMDDKRTIIFAFRLNKKEA